MFYLIPYLTVLDNVLLADIRGNRRKKQASALLEKFGLSQRLRHYPVQLSAGEQQRVAMARALLNNPRVILADEPTGNLDPENAAEVVNHLIEFNKNGGTVLLATHQQSRFIDNARQISLKAGRLI